DTDAKETSPRAEIPYLLSYLSYGKLSGEVAGVNPIPTEYEPSYGEGDAIPPVKTPVWSFRLRVFFGAAMIFLSLFGLVFRKWSTIEKRTLFLKISILMIFAPYLANTFGWIMSEMGRQPWIVQGLFQTADAISPNVLAGDI